MAKLRVNASTVKRAEDVRKLVIRMNLARRLLNVLIVENVMLHIIKNAVFIKRSMAFNQSGCPEKFLFFEARQVYQKTHRQRVMSYAGATKAPIQSSSICTQTDVSWVGPQPVTRRQRPAAPSSSRPLPSVSRSVGTTTRVVNVKKPVVATKSSPAKKDKQIKQTFFNEGFTCS